MRKILPSLAALLLILLCACAALAAIPFVAVLCIARRPKLFLKLAVTAGFLFILYSKIDIANLASRFTLLKWQWIAAAFALMTLNTFVSSRKWQIFLAADSIRVSVWRLFQSHLIGSFFNLFLPSTIGGDVYRVADIGGKTDKMAGTAASIIADRITGFLALAIYGLAASAIVRDAIPNWQNRLLLLPGCALMALIAFTAALCMPSFIRLCCRIFPAKIEAKLLKIINPVLDSIQIYVRHPLACLRVMLLAFVFQLSAILAVYSLGKAVGLDVALGPYFFFVPFITLMEMIPVSIFGIGLRDTGYLWFMKAVGTANPADDAAMISIIYVATTIIYVGFGGILFLFKKDAKTPGAGGK